MADGFGLLDREVQFVKGIGPKRAVALGEMGVENVRDLLHFYPRRYLDRTTVTPFDEIGQADGQVTIDGIVRSAAVIPSRRGRRYEIVLEDESGRTTRCVWFRGVAWVQKTIHSGMRIAVHGKPQLYNKKWSFPHPDFDLLDADTPKLSTGRIIALYPGSESLAKAGVSSALVRRVVYNLFKDEGIRIPEIFPGWVKEKYGLIDGRVALRAIHRPRDQAELDAAIHRLKFEELFWIQLLLRQTLKLRERTTDIILEKPGSLSRQFFTDHLPFELTDDQKRALHQIYSDAQSGKQMNRLLQGDVGCGKTVVAIGALLQAVDSGYQGVLMAPTEILAEQHLAKVKGYLEPLGVRVVHLSGSLSRTRHRDTLDAIKTGTAQIVVGTHAVIQDTVAFGKMGMVVIDEQHRFGVMQRASLSDKGDRPHILLMTATPIPRSLTMTLYGDLDVTTIRQKPKGRQPIITRLFNEKRRTKMYELLRSQLNQGRQAFVVYPLVEESEKMDLRDAVSGCEQLSMILHDKNVGLIHGRMKQDVREEKMSRFVMGEIDVLVATTVIEVGVDIPNATVMIIEHAERFGLSQLHQLRGRVGRGKHASYCLLMADYKKTSVADERLAAMEETNDGFKISELDLSIRGGGDYFGTRQSGLPDLKIANIVEDLEIIEDVREAALECVSRDQLLERAEHKTMRTYFEKYIVAKRLKFADIG